MYYSDEIIEEVRQKSDIVNVIGRYVKLKRVGQNYVGLCPFHNEKTGSFNVTPSRQMYYCFGCHASGDVFTFLMNYDNVTFPEAVKELAEQANIALPENDTGNPEAKRQADKRSKLLAINKEAATYYYYMLKSDRGAAGRAYFAKRKLLDTTIKAFALGFAPENSSLYAYLKSKNYSDELLRASGLFVYENGRVREKFFNRVIYPIMDINNKVIGFGGRVMGDAKPKYLNSPETDVFNKRKNLYGLNVARHTREKYMILCEGYMDVIALHQAGFTNSVASLGTALTDDQCHIISRYVKEVYLTYDSDGAGVNATKRAIPMMKDHGINVKIIRMEPYKDPDEFIKNLGKEEFQKRIDSAQSSFEFQMSDLEKQFDLNDPEGKSDFLDSVSKMLVGISDELYRDTYEKAVAAKYNVPEQMLIKRVNKIGAKVRLEEEGKEAYEEAKKLDKKQDVNEGNMQTERLFLSWLADKPELYQRIRGKISPSDFSVDIYREAAEVLFAQIENEKQANPPKILNRFDTVEEKDTVAKIFTENPGIDINSGDFIKSFSQTATKIMSASLLRQLDKASETGDMNAMNEIIKRQREIKNGSLFS
ncbi:MAG: DNA primase [Catonella sp.]|nr:DNA primase [Catonella sp.]MDY6356282.1 DNA primase [Catonella sp.]